MTTLDLAPADGDTSSVLQEGTVVGGRYRILRVLGRGGMGFVYACEHISVGRKVALKVLHRSIVDPEIRRRFQGEARAASAAGHPNIVDVLDAGELEDGRPYIAMELIEGPTLMQELETCGTLPPTRACMIARDVARAMAAAHAAGIIHRDLKPDNVILAKDERVKVVDFGIAHGVMIREGRVTKQGLCFGTPEYMAPEQAAGRPASPTFDIYALGVILFEMLAGLPPILEATAVQTMSAKLERDAPSIAKFCDAVDPGLVDLVNDCLARDPTKRPASADLVVQRLTSTLEVITQPAFVAVAPLPPGPRRRRTPFRVLAPAMIAGAMLVGGATAMLDRSGRAHALESQGVLMTERLPDTRPDWPELRIPHVPAPVDLPPPSPSEPTPQPEPAPQREPAPQPESAPASAPQAPPPQPRPLCRMNSERAQSARRIHDWETVLRETASRPCWPDETLRVRLRTLAFRETQRWEDCIRTARGVRDQETERSAKVCALRKDQP